MSILGVGIDILSILRIKRIIKNKLGTKFSQKILSNYELNILPNCKQNYTKFLANRFSVKEAASKALGTGIRNGLKFSDLELHHDKNGKPYLKFLKQAKKMLQAMNTKSTHVSLSDEKLYVCAIVIFED
ncbi:holo-[acyl-carrier protein] synthase [Buchnera aphidicola str. Bp (Baizongia pistaciae)]|uniref:Holo-[acyl-carrier-protein] synthase n=1 Tax=Buchnera aphidicola subsp. Baizongia pistaciae (strain Bp) TaxID=224915 RepID=ACPS_BUCBP|nr:holo-ACP synthase [Buchnera aphidicola]P59475.1 RecName: Full=Holo-[acyl-carrier-protein] synthase; Short=Holo-ACP synthase; AltName: Full=4'-phosphopantetheinyl transferase AcpS [Buchnera aphidicola str. Bp (Baizongia pistaciae)]AAO26964.1 holo-[acyl-carrier protein] synthase [Buchnera aphidicola str. Bp (Baizongia pistaciae)]